MNKILLSMLATTLIVGGGAFYGGMQYQKSQTSTTAGQFFLNGQNVGGNRMGRAGFGGAQGRNAGGFTNGTIASKDANSLTLSLRDGGSKIVFFATSTNIGKMTSGSDADLTKGEQITVVGTANADGSITANTIQIRPEGEPLGMPRPQGNPAQ